jgi:hypothetical protein
VLGAWYEWFVFNYETYATLNESNAFLLARARIFVKSYWPVYTAVASVGGLIWLRRGDRPLLVLLAATFATALVSLIVQHKGWDYHYAAFLPVLVLLMTEALAWAARILTEGPLARIRQNPHAVIPVAAAALLVLATTLTIGYKLVRLYRIPVGWQLGFVRDEVYVKTFGLDGVDAVVAYVQAHTSPRDTVWSFTDAILDLNHLARRKSPSRFWNPYHIFHAVAPFRYADRWQAEVATTLRDHPPEIVVMHVDPKTHRYEYPPDWSRSPLVKVFNDALATRYRLVETIGPFEIHRLCHPTVTTGS